MPKKKTALTIEERLQQALVPLRNSLMRCRRIGCGLGLEKLINIFLNQ